LRPLPVTLRALLCWLCIPSLCRAQTPPLWNLVLLHAIHPAEGSGAELGNIQTIALMNDGSVYVAEHDPARIVRFDNRGRYVGVVMRDGAGPGETRFPEVAAEGDTLVVYDPALGRLTRFGPNGRVLTERMIGVGWRGFGQPLWTTDDGSVLINAGVTRPGWSGSAVRVAPNGRTDTVFWQHPKSEDRSLTWQGPGWMIVGRRAPFSPPGLETFDRLGHVIIGGTKRARFVVVSGRDTVQTVQFDDHETVVPPRIRDSAWSAYRATLPANFPNVYDVVREDQIPTTLPPWLSVNVDTRGDWWVGRPSLNGSLGTFDVVHGGRVIGRAAVPSQVLNVTGPGYGMAFGRDLVALLHENHEGVPWIGVYGVLRGSK
jgi:hypothetical protein